MPGLVSHLLLSHRYNLTDISYKHASLDHVIVNGSSVCLSVHLLHS